VNFCVRTFGNYNLPEINGDEQLSEDEQSHFGRKQRPKLEFRAEKTGIHLFIKASHRLSLFISG